jgi:predicted aspartyl protease
LQRAHRANGGAGRIVAVHAQADELVTAREHDGHFVVRLYFFCGNPVVIRKLVLAGAGLFALLAADANRGII